MFTSIKNNFLLNRYQAGILLCTYLKCLEQKKQQRTNSSKTMMVRIVVVVVHNVWMTVKAVYFVSSYLNGPLTRRRANDQSMHIHTAKKTKKKIQLKITSKHIAFAHLGSI